jgi:integrase
LSRSSPRRRRVPSDQPTVRYWEWLIERSRPNMQANLGVCAFAGLRLGEASAVNLGDVDFLGRRLHVRRQVQRRRGGPAELRQPKYGSERTIYLPSRLVEMLARHVERAGTAAEGWLFYTSDGRPIPPSTVNSWWQFQPTPADQLAHLAVDDLQCTGRSRHGTPVAPPGQDVDGQ